VLDQVAASLVANPEIRIEIAGYTDATGQQTDEHAVVDGACGGRATLPRAQRRKPDADASAGIWCVGLHRAEYNA